MRWRTDRVVLLLISAALGVAPWDARGDDKKDDKKADGAAKTERDRELIRDTMKSLAQGKGKREGISITYDDIHGLYGGLRLEIDGNGKVEQKTVRTQAGKAKTVAPEDLKQIVELLVELKAWEQIEEERPPRPDEGRASLTIKYDDHTTKIWEWHHDLAKNQRIDKVLTLMKKAAWEAPVP